MSLRRRADQPRRSVPRRLRALGEQWQKTNGAARAAGVLAVAVSGGKVA